MKTNRCILPALNIESLLAFAGRLFNSPAVPAVFACQFPALALSLTGLYASGTATAEGGTELPSHGAAIALSRTKLLARLTQYASGNTAFLLRSTAFPGHGPKNLSGYTGLTNALTKALRACVYKVYNRLKIFAVYTDSSPPALGFVFL